MVKVGKVKVLTRDKGGPLTWGFTLEYDDGLKFNSEHNSKSAAYKANKIFRR